ncbi:MAG: adenylate/guanylate cyclase domain-containing protein [Alphaproteobacteria bacterium]|nr:adenylate/guanylate cyclase domain-containing protein [Alphaproteobacteria bacterium]
MSQSIERGPASTILVDKAARWLLEQALFDVEIGTMLAGCYERLSAAGIPISRAHLVLSILHPLYSSLGITWRPGDGISIEGYQHFLGDDIPESFRTSPYYQLKNQNIEFIRRRIEGLDVGGEFPILGELAQQGNTDYLAFGLAFNTQGDKGVLGSWSTDRPGGFTDSEIAALLNLNDPLAVACKMAVQREVASNVVTTYLGTDAGNRVLNGNIKRGDGETTRAAIIYGDLRGSTAMADQEGRQAYIDALNDFFDATGGAISAQGGEVLSFIGDAFLAVYPCGRNRKESVVATQAALASSYDAIIRMNAINKDRVSSNLAALGYGMSLHIGNVMFGNVGMPDRLAYSVFGSTVNEAARLEGLTTKYKRPVLGSSNFKDYAGGDWQELGSEALKGVAQPMAIYAPAPN